MEGRCGHSVSPFLRTSYAHAPKVLIRAVGVVARATCRLVLAERLLRIDLVTESRRQKATRNIVCKVGMVAIRLEHTERTLVRSELGQFKLVIFRGNLFLVSWAWCRVVNVQLAV